MPYSLGLVLFPPVFWMLRQHLYVVVVLPSIGIEYPDPVRENPMQVIEMCG